MKKRIWIAGASLVAIVIVVAAIIAVASPFNSTKVSTATVERRGLDLTINASGKVTAEKKSSLSPQLPGTVSSIYVKEGDFVEKEAPILSLESSDLAIAVDQAAINAEIAWLNEENAQSASKTAQNTLDKARAGATSEQLAVSAGTVSQAQAGVDAASQAVEDIEDLNTSGESQAQKAVEQAQSSFTAAGQGVEDAEEQLTEARAIPLTDIEIMTYESAHHQAQAAYDAARLALDNAGLALEGTKQLNEQSLHSAQSGLQTAQKGYDLAKSQYNLVKAGASKYDISALESQLKITKGQQSVATKQASLAELSLETAELQLDKATLKAPISGLIADINVKEGETVTPGVPGVPALAVVIDSKSLKFEASIDESDVVKVQKGQSAKISLDAYSKKSYRGVVESVGFTTVPTEGGATAYAATIAFDDNNINGLREGMNGDVDVVVGKVRDALAVPDSAVLAEEGESYVFLIGEDDTLKKVSFIMVCDNTKRDLDRCQKCGANSLVTRPVDPEVFLEKVSRLIDILKRTGIRVLIKVSVKGDLGNQPFFCTSVNISASGILLEVDRAISRGEKITCSFFIPGSDSISVDGEIMRVVDIAPNTFHWGVKFLNLRKDHKTAIEAFVKKKT